MGYILPITHYDYINYEHRMRKGEQSPHYVDKPFKVILNKTSREFDQENNHMFNRWEGENYNQFEKGIRVQRSLHAEITGKGRYVNVKV